MGVKFDMSKYRDLFITSIADAKVEKVEKVKKEKPETEEWIWVTGYKGMNKDMMCRDHQFELDKQYDIPENETVLVCRCGFHFCKDLKDVFNYYDIGNGNRYFQVSGLVRKKDYEEYGKTVLDTSSIFVSTHKRDKLAAKSIVITRELTLEEIVADYILYLEQYAEQYKSWTSDDWKLALETSVDEAWRRQTVKELIELGYSEVFSEHISRSNNATCAAKMVAAQPGVSMDVKVLTIMNTYQDRSG